MIQDILQNPTTAQDMLIKTSGAIGATSSAFGLAIDKSDLSFWMGILADAGVFMGGVVAVLTLLYTIYKGKRKDK